MIAKKFVLARYFLRVIKALLQKSGLALVVCFSSLYVLSPSLRRILEGLRLDGLQHDFRSVHPQKSIGIFSEGALHGRDIQPRIDARDRQGTMVQHA